MLRQTVRSFALFPMVAMLLAAMASAQAGAKDARRVALDVAAAKELSALARTAASQKLVSLGREVAALVIERYAPEDAAARKLLGQKKVKGVWQADGTTAPADAATDRNRAALLGKWRELKQTVAKLHKDLGLAMRSEGAAPEQWRPECELALQWLPSDRECNEALGRHQIDGFWGTADDVAFVQRLRSMLDQARELRAKDFEVTTVAASEMPIELQRTGLAMFGARGTNYLYWTTGTQENANNLVRWSERTHAMLQFLLAEQAPLVRGDSWQWHAVLRSVAERDALLEKSPNTRGPFTLDQAQLFVGIGFQSESGRRAAVTWEPATIDEDYAIANVTRRHLLDMRNDGLGEGLVHAMCWMLNGTTSTYFIDLAKTVAGGIGPIKRDPDLWFERLWQEIEQGSDQPLSVVARERPENFRDSTRIKSWSFMVWVLAAYPDRWMAMIDAVSNIELSPPIVDKAIEGVFGKTPAALDAEWRRWARAGSALGKVTGWGPSK